MGKKTKIEVEFELFSLSFNYSPLLWWISFLHFTIHEHSFAMFYFEYSNGRYLFDIFYLSLIWNWISWWKENVKSKS